MFHIPAFFLDIQGRWKNRQNRNIHHNSHITYIVHSWYNRDNRTSWPVQGDFTCASLRDGLSMPTIL
jgi:hypothetical protein